MAVLIVGLAGGSSSLGTVTIEETGHTSGVSLASSPEISRHRILDGFFFLLSCSLLVHHVDSLLTDEYFIFSQHKVFGMSTGLWLRNREFRASKVDPSLWVVEVGDFALIINEDRDFAESVRATVLTIFSLDIFVQFHTGSAEELEASDFR